MVKVFAWPPVGVISSYWTLEQPKSTSRSLFSGREWVSAHARKRILAGIMVHGRRQSGSGYMEALWRYTEGGINLVRARSCRIPWGNRVSAEERGGGFFDWAIPTPEFDWETPPTDFIWFWGRRLTYTVGTSNGLPIITVSGLPPNSNIAAPGDFLWLHTDSGVTPVVERTIMIMNAVRSNASGVAVAVLQSPAPANYVIQFGANESAVFRMVTDFPKIWRRNGNSDHITLEFRQVFEDETDGFVEVNPWI